MEFLRDREAFSQLANKAGLNTRDNWYEIDNSADDEAIIYVYSEIGYFGATAEEFVAELKDITASKITVRINSLGGSIFETIGIFHALRSHPAQITTQVDAIAASAASVIVQAGDHRVMLDNSEMMIHEAHGIAVGATAADMREMADILDNQTTKIAEIYAKRKGDGRTKGHFLALMRAGASNMGTWFSAKETVSEGLADVVVTPLKNQMRAGVTLGGRVQRQRESLNLTLEELSDRMNGPGARSANTLSQIENGTIDCPPPEVIRSLAGALNVSADSLFDAGESDGCNYEGRRDDKATTPTDFTDLFNTDPEDFEWSTPKETLV